MADEAKNASRLSAIDVAKDNDQTLTGGPDNLKVIQHADSFEYAEIEGRRWNRSYPYQLLVVEAKNGNYTAINNWKYTFALPPQSLDIDTPFANNLSATLGGTVEETNGAPFRMISFSGTTGVLPLKGDTAANGFLNTVSTAADTLTPIFGGTISATSNAIDNSLNFLRSEGVFSPTLNILEDNTFEKTNGAGSEINRTSGYYQWHLLRKFLEGFSKIKKTPVGRKLHLAFAIWKDQGIYLVSLQNFKLIRGADSPLEYRYALQLKAYGRVLLNTQAESIDYKPVGRSPSRIASALNVLVAARQALQDARKILQSVRQDINSALFTPMNELIMGSKDALNLKQTAAEYNSGIIGDLRTPWLAMFSKQKSSNPNSTPDQVQSSFQSYFNTKLIDSFNKDKQDSERTGKSLTNVAGLSYTASAINNSPLMPKLWSNPEDNLDFFEKINLTDLEIPISTQLKIQNETDRIKRYTRADFEKQRDSVLSVMTDFADAVGLGNDTYNKTLGIAKSASNKLRDATDDDYTTLFHLNSVVMQFNKFAASDTINPNRVSSVEFIAGLATQSGIAFTTPISKILVPWLYGYTIEEFALKYLGDSNRWMEIAALNGLREPYVDEVGFTKSLLTNGISNEIQLSDIKNLYVGQVVYISSAIVPPERRRITGIIKISSTLYIVQLSGTADLDRFTFSAESKIRAYLPDTINSQMSLYIPSDQEPSEDNFVTKAIPGVDYFDNLVRIGGISILLDQNNDIVITPDGRSQLAIGLTNIVQKIRVGISTPKGALKTHPNYGLEVQPGASTADASADDVLRSIRNMYSKDPTFSSITSAKVLKKGPVSQISVNVQLAGVNQNIPISINVQR